MLGEGLELLFHRDHVRVESRLGNTPRFIRFPHDARCEVPDNDALDRALAQWRAAGRARGCCTDLEASWRLALLAVVVMGLVAAGLILFGLPVAAKHIAYGLPMSVSERLGTDALAFLDQVFFKPSKLPEERQAELHAQFQELLRQQADTYPYSSSSAPRR